jgi:hypothetical protein
MTGSPTPTRVPLKHRIGPKQISSYSRPVLVKEEREHLRMLIRETPNLTQKSISTAIQIVKQKGSVVIEDEESDPIGTMIVYFSITLRILLNPYLISRWRHRRCRRPPNVADRCLTVGISTFAQDLLGPQGHVAAL